MCNPVNSGMRRVIHVGYQHSSTDVRILKKECTSLAASGKYSVTYVTSDKNSNGNGFTEGKVEVKVLPLRGRKKMRLIWYLADVFKYIESCGFEIVHIHEYLLLPLAAKLIQKGYKVVYDKHENTVGEVSNLFGDGIVGRLAGRFAEKYENRIVKKASGFIIVTPYYNSCDESINDYGTLIPNYPPKGIVNEGLSYDEYLKNLGVVCFAGGISNTWSIVKVARILETDGGFKLLLAGKVDNDYLESISTYTCTSYLGVLPFEEVADIYKRSFAGVALLNSRVKSLNSLGTLGNTKLFEIMASGLPVICSNSLVWQEIIEKYRCGLCVDPNDEDAILEAFRYLKDNPQDAYRMGNRGIDAVKNEYNWELSEVRLLALYESIPN